MEAAYTLALTALSLLPAQFWALTPAETADLLTAYRARENRIHTQRAWEIYQLLAPYISEGSEVTPISLFRQMPGAFPEDADLPPEVKRGRGAHPPGLTPEQIRERERRMAIPRLQQPR